MPDAEKIVEKAISEAIDLWQPNLGDPNAMAARAAVDALREAGMLTETEWEYGWRALFDNGEEFEWLNRPSREVAEYEAREYQAEEDRTHRPGSDGHLTYSVWRRRISKPGPWEPVEGDPR